MRIFLRCMSINIVQWFVPCFSNKLSLLFIASCTSSIRNASSLVCLGLTTSITGSTVEDAGSCFFVVVGGLLLKKPALSPPKEEDDGGFEADTGLEDTGVVAEVIVWTLSVGNTSESFVTFLCCCGRDCSS